MIISDKAHQYLIGALTKASNRSFSTLIGFVTSVEPGELKQIIENAEKLVESEIPKTYRRTVQRALSKISEKWWQTFESPPNWLVQATYLYLMSETLGYAADFPIVYERLLNPREIAKHLPLYLSYGVHTTVLIDPTENELEKELGKEGVSVDSKVLKDILRAIVKKHAKIDVDRKTVDILGKVIYYDDDSFLMLLNFTGMYDVKKELISRTVQTELVSELARILNVSSDDIKAEVRPSYGYGGAEVVLTVPSTAIEQRYPEIKNIVTYIKAYLSLSRDRLSVSNISFSIGMAQGTSFDVNYSTNTLIRFRDCARVLVEKMDETVKNIVRLHEEMLLVKKLGEYAGAENTSVNYRVENSSSGQITLEGTVTGRVQGTGVKLMYTGVIEDGKVKSRNVVSRLYFDLESRRLASSVIPEDLRYYLVGEGVKVLKVDAKAYKDESYVVVYVEHPSLDSIQSSIQTTIKVVSDYLSTLRKNVSSQPSMKDEHAVAMYLYAKVIGKDRFPAVFNRPYTEMFMKVGRLLSKLDSVRYSSIKDTLNKIKRHEGEGTLLDVFNDVVKVFVETNYINVDDEGRFIINGRRFTDIMHECTEGKVPLSVIESIEQDVLTYVLRGAGFSLLNKVAMATGKIPDRIVNALDKAYLIYDLSFLLKPVAGKPLVAYLPDDVKVRMVERLFPQDIVTILTTPDYEVYFSSVKNVLLDKVLTSAPGVVTRYAYVKMPELFAGVSATVVEGNDYDYMLDCGKWFCQVGKIGREKHVFILYRKDAKVGVAFVARNLAEALEKAEEQYDEGLKVVNLLKASAPSLSKLGLAYDEYKSYGTGTVLPLLYSSRDNRKYYITPMGGTRLLDMVKEQEEEKVMTSA